jgi:hypothetical protein
MDIPVQQLAEQLARIERELGEIRRGLASPDRPLDRGSLPLAAAASEVAWADKGRLRDEFDRLLAQRITAEPIGATALQQQIAREGLEPNELSQGLIAARDE